MKTKKTLAQVANDIENGNIYYNDTTIKAGQFGTFADFLSYYRQHYRPILQAIANGEDLTAQPKRLLQFMANDLLELFSDPEADAEADAEAEEEDPTLTEQEKRETLYNLWDAAWAAAKADPDNTRVIVDTSEEDPSAPNNEFGRYYMIDYWKAEDTEEGVGRWVVIRVDVAESPFEVHRPNWHYLNGFADRATQPHCRVSNPGNVTRWAEKMINAGRVTDIYADCY